MTPIETIKNALEKTRNENHLMAYTSAGDPKLNGEMKLHCAVKNRMDEALAALTTLAEEREKLVEGLRFYAGLETVKSFLGTPVEGFENSGLASFGIPVGTKARAILSALGEI